MRQDYREQMDSHPLRREIIVTQVVNDLVNFAGITFFHRLSQETSASAEELARAHFVCREIYGVNALIEAINELDNEVDAPQSRPTCGCPCAHSSSGPPDGWSTTAAPRSTREATVDHFGTAIAQVVEALPELVQGIQADEFRARHEQLRLLRVPDELATAVASCRRRTRRSRSSRSPSGMGSTPSRSPTCTRRWRTGSG